MDISKRLNFTVDKFGSPSPYATEHGQYVRHVDYAKLEAEAQGLREQNTKFQHMLADVVAKHFAENIKRSTAQKSMDVYLSEGIRLLEEEVEDARRNAEQHELQANRYSEELAALRARVVVPDGYALVPAMPTEAMLKAYRDISPSWLCLDGWRAMAEVAPRLNGKAVSEGLLRETIRSVDDIFWAIHAKPSCQSGVVARCRCSLCSGTRLAMARDDLSALLGEGKEVGDA